MRVSNSCGGGAFAGASIPEHAGNIFAGGEQEAANVLVGLPVDWRRDEKVLDWKWCQLVHAARLETQSAYDYLLAAMRQLHRAAGSVARPGRGGRSRGRPVLPVQEAAWRRGRWSTCCPPERVVGRSWDSDGTSGQIDGGCAATLLRRLVARGALRTWRGEAQDEAKQAKEIGERCLRYVNEQKLNRGPASDV